MAYQKTGRPRGRPPRNSAPEPVAAPPPEVSAPVVSKPIRRDRTRPMRRPYIGAGLAIALKSGVDIPYPKPGRPRSVVRKTIPLRQA